MFGRFELSYHSLAAPKVQAGGCLAPQTTSRRIEVTTVSASSHSMSVCPMTGIWSRSPCIERVGIQWTVAIFVSLQTSTCDARTRLDS